MSKENDDEGRRPPRRRQAGAPGAGWVKRPPEGGWAGGRPRSAPSSAKRERAPAPSGPHSAFEGDRIAKVIARAGLCSRREAEDWIGQGRVAVNGRVLDSPAFNVSEGDQVVVDGKPLARRERTRLWLFHKPRGTITTDSDPEGRKTIFEALPEGLPRVVTIGRLDFNTEGLLLLTNDGGLARALELPATGWLRRYRVRANGAVDQGVLDALAAGVTVEGVHYAGIEASLDREQGANVWLTLGLREGKNREVKRVLEHLGLAVNRLIRVSFGPFQLGELAEGEVLEIRTRVLRDQLGEAIAGQAGADFDAPVREEEERAASRRAAERSSARASAQRAEPQARKHISAMRAEREREQSSGPRKRIERDATADRRGRSIQVERIRPAAGAAKGASRNARRFAGERDRARDPRAPGDERRGEHGERAQRSGQPPRSDRSDPRAEGREYRSKRENSRDPREQDRRARPSRSAPGRERESGELGERRFERGGRRLDHDKAGRAPEGARERFSRPPREDARRTSRADRPDRGKENRGSRQERPDRSSRDGRKPSAGGEGRRPSGGGEGRKNPKGGFRAHPLRAGRPGGAPRSGGKPGGGPRSGGKPGGRPGRPPRGR